MKTLLAIGVVVTALSAPLSHAHAEEQPPAGRQSESGSTVTKAKRAVKTGAHKVGDAARAVGHGTRDAAKAVGHGASDAAHGVGTAAKKAWGELTGKGATERE